MDTHSQFAAADCHTGRPTAVLVSPKARSGPED
jgi:hypothetical protein